MRARVESARSRQRAHDPRSNATLPTRLLAEVVQLDAEADRLLERAVERLALSARAIDRVRRVARTIADLEGSAGVGAGHLAEALQYWLLDRPDPDRQGSPHTPEAHPHRGFSRAGNRAR